MNSARMCIRVPCQFFQQEHLLHQSKASARAKKRVLSATRSASCARTNQLQLSARTYHQVLKLA